ncbi:hypothetical protein P8452_56195 [Trifolium repens]|nr:hypothetical protein P8452_56195 [Trifolium repens]
MPRLSNINDLIEQAVADYNNDNTYNTIHNMQGYEEAVSIHFPLTTILQLCEVDLSDILLRKALAPFYVAAFTMCL